MSQKNAFPKLIKLMQRLRGPDGCPWDRKQTHQTLRPFLLEEAHEVLEAIRARNPHQLQDELGDLLFQVVFHAQLAAEAGQFDIYDVIDTSLAKMTRRHPHVFGLTRLRTAGEVLENWEEIKRRERNGSGRSLLAGVPRSLPALLRAHRVQAKAARVGFTWARIDEALAKVLEEITELEAALLASRQKRIMEELGDVFFALVNLARFAGANPEDALHQAVGKFIRRFAQIEKASKRQKKPFSAMSQEELCRLWEQAKNQREPRKGPGKPPPHRQKRAAGKNQGLPKPDPHARRR
ncbi:nucleoside triphosphate pyrophosphohydrolase [candidate division FCPU426 bacterium]|nr:nucleoside triphosphate pyrophosphohydrolase [candidate division FCPU426 bacterium]